MPDLRYDVRSLPRSYLMTDTHNATRVVVKGGSELALWFAFFFGTRASGVLVFGSLPPTIDNGKQGHIFH